MIKSERNEQFWKACGWTPVNSLAPEYLYQWRGPDGDPDLLPVFASVSFVGYLLRDALPKAREKWGNHVDVKFSRFQGQEECWISVGPGFLGQADTLSEAAFIAFEKALLGPQDSQQAG